MLLENKVCLIAGTGSLRGIGYAVAELFAREGARLALADRSMTEARAHLLRSAIEDTLGRRIEMIGIACDIVDRAQTQALCDAVVSRFGTIDILVNCVGIVDSSAVLDIAEDEFERMVAVNLKGAMFLCQAVLRVLAEARKGSIVNIASLAAQRGGGLVGGAHYAASKGGLISLTKTIAREFGPVGIRANVVSPSMTDTSMLDGRVTSERYADVVAQIPLRRAGRPIDIAGACLFLASELSAYVTGATIDVNGGSHIH